jgi:hypothetical protein
VLEISLAQIARISLKLGAHLRSEEIEREDFE